MAIKLVKCEYDPKFAEVLLQLTKTVNQNNKPDAGKGELDPLRMCMNMSSDIKGRLCDILGCNLHTLCVLSKGICLTWCI